MPSVSYVSKTDSLNYKSKPLLLLHLHYKHDKENSEMHCKISVNVHDAPLQLEEYAVEVLPVLVCIKIPYC